MEVTAKMLTTNGDEKSSKLDTDVRRVWNPETQIIGFCFYQQSFNGNQREQVASIIIIQQQMQEDAVNDGQESKSKS